MKYLPCSFLAAVVALSFSSCAAPSGGGAAAGEQTQLGPHSGQKFTLISRSGSHAIDPNFILTMALVLTVDQKMVDGRQEITAKAVAHKDGPGGAIANVAGLRVHVLQPEDFGTQPKTSGQAGITKSIPAPGGKYKTVVAEASIKSPDYPDTTISLTIPGDK